MQYMRNMFDGRAKLEPLDNDRYPRLSPDDCAGCALGISSNQVNVVCRIMPARLCMGAPAKQDGQAAIAKWPPILLK